MLPKYNLDKIRFATDPATFERAVEIYQSGGILMFDESGYGFCAKVRGSGENNYRVNISAKHFDECSCSCYLGQRDILCKHCVATSICAVKQGDLLSIEELNKQNKPLFKNELGQLNIDEYKGVKLMITESMKYIKSYSGFSRTWFAYQASLDEGCARLRDIVSDLPIGKQTADLLVDILLRLNKKLQGVDDSDGIVGGCLYDISRVLIEFVRIDPDCMHACEKLCKREICFEWNEQIVHLIDEPDIFWQEVYPNLPAI